MFSRDLSTPSTEDLSDFLSLSCYQNLVADKSFTPIRSRARPLPEVTVTQRSFFTRTLWTKDTVRACQAFYKGPMMRERWAGAVRSGDARAGLGAIHVLYSLGSGLDGHAGHAHGGFVAVLLDEAMGLPAYIQMRNGCVTAYMRTDFKRGVPTPGVVMCSALVEKVEGRKMLVRASLGDGKGTTFATGEALYIMLREKL